MTATGLSDKAPNDERLRVVEFTDPGCPFGFSAEPHRLRLRWVFGDQLAWELRMIVIARSREENAGRGLEPGMIAEQAVGLANQFGMPLYTDRRIGVPATLDACRTVVATRRHASDLEWLLLRRLRVLSMSGGMIDDANLIRKAIKEVGLDPILVESWINEPETEALLAEDMNLARNPSPAGLALPQKLGRDRDRVRYAPPSYEFSYASNTYTVPGLHTALAYETAVANLAPQFDRREDPSKAAEVLRWAGYPVATQEVAEVCRTSREDAARMLEAEGARRIPAATDAYWTL